MSIKTITFNATGSDQSFTVPPFVEKIMVKAWGGGGAISQGNGNGGPGGYSTGTLPVSSGQVLNIMVGLGGNPYSTSGVYGGGGQGGVDHSGSNIYGSGGGGRSGVAINSGAQLIIAGGGGGCAGGSTIWVNGGAGGGINGIDGWVTSGGNTNAQGKGASQSAGGAGGIATNAAGNGFTGTALQGGQGGKCVATNAGGGGGGGGGYFGGGGGGGQYIYSSDPLDQDAAAGGGSGYISSSVLNGATYNTPQNTNTNINPTYLVPPNTSDPNYITGIGTGGSFSSGPIKGGDGLVVLVYDQPDLIMNKTVNNNFADIDSVLNYTISIQNSSPSVTVTNISFIDTIPNGTTLVQNSFTLNGASIPGSPNPPGITISSINPGATSTVQFSAKVFSTVPNPNNLNNIATSSYIGGFTFNSNIVTTTINNATLTSLKSSNKSFATVGNTITYTITIANSGSVTANNILLVDTIVNSVTLVSGSFTQDGTPISGSPNPPGAILPKPIAPQSTSTITYQVTVITIPSPNPILNSASQIFTYTINPTSSPNITNTSTSNSNTTSTTINYASLNLSKIVNKDFATCGDILAYTIALSNIGNATALNVLFIDTIPGGAILVANSVNINGTTIPGTNPTTGITIPSIQPYSTTTISFQAQVSC